MTKENGMKGQAKIILLVILGVLLLGGFYCVSTYNAMVRLHEQIPGAYAQVNVVLQRRNDLIPNLVSTVKGFAKQEQTIYGQISQALASFNKATTVSGKVAADNTLSGLIRSMMAVSLQYPALQSNQQFLRLQDELAGTENRIAVERRTFNETVLAYNSRVKTFPTSLIAKFGNLQPEEYFKATDAAQTAPQVQF
jgi:LemA protein